jgi:eukaryotic-like serine/threonine-protein kinase
VPHTGATGSPTRLLTDGTGRRFELLERIGAGGFGEVHRARMWSASGLDQQVAVKLLHPGFSSTPESQALERLRDEARLLTALRHPVVLAALDLVELDGRVALVTEFIEGQDLSACLRGADPGGIEPTTLLEVVEQVASALDLAWRELSVVHRDVKPSNIRVGIHGNVKLLDFGIARSGLEGRAARTATHIVVGTLGYLAPERFDAEERPEPASDVFSLGCVLYDGITGQPFHRELGAREMFRLAMVPEEWAAFQADRLARVPPGPIGELLAEMLAYRVADRPTAAEVARRCEAITTATPGHVPLRRWCRARAEAQTAPNPVPAEPTPVPATVGTLELPASRAEARQDPSPRPSEPSPVPATLGTLDLPVTRAGARPGRARWAVGAGLLTAGGASVLTAAAAGVGAIGLLGGLVWLGSGEAELPPGPLQVRGPEPEPSPPEASAPAPAPVEASVPATEPQPTRAPEPGSVRAPAPAEPAPAGDPVAAPVYTVTLTSVPLGAEILRADGESIGSTPFMGPLEAGRHTIRLVAPDGRATTRTIQVGKNAPTRYIWTIEGDGFASGY